MAVHIVGRPEGEIDDLLARIAALEAMTFQHAAIGRGGMRVYDGGWVRIENGGLDVTGTANVTGVLNVSGTQNLTGNLLVQPGGYIEAGTVRIDQAGAFGGRIASSGVVLALEAVGGVVVTAPSFVAPDTSVLGDLAVDGNTTLSGSQVVSNASTVTHWVGVTASRQIVLVPKAAGGPQGSGDFAWPFPLSTVTDEYGPRPGIGDGFHNGIDFGVAEGTPIPAPADGTVSGKGYDGDRGNWIALSHGDRGAGEIVTRYFHMQNPSPLALDASVAKGASVGLVGNTGFSTGPHLHWETWVNGVDMNPRSFMAIYG